MDTPAGPKYTFPHRTLRELPPGMPEERAQRRLAAILATDVVGYSRMMGADELGTLAAVKAWHKDVVEPLMSKHNGRIVKLIGDGVLAEFASAVNAVECAVELQKVMAAASESVAEGKRITLRVGVNLGDVIVEGSDLYGDGVNVAARLEAMAEPGGICLSDDAHRQVRDKLNITFEDAGEHQLKNIARPMRIFHVRPGKMPFAPLQGLALPDMPSIAVLPFANMSADPEQDHFSDGLVEDIITTLSKLGGLRMVARNSSFVYKGRSIDVREEARQLGVRYVLEGSVRRSSNRVRVTAQLIDATDGSHLWAERYDRTIDDIFAIQDEITLVVATELQVKLTEGEQARLRYTTTSNVAAWTNWVKGLTHFRRAVTKDNMGPARQYWEKAHALDPSSAALHAMLGFIHCLDARFGWWDFRETALGQAQDYTSRAIELDPNNADAHTSLSLIFLLQERFDEAVSEAKLAVQLAPGSADAAELASFVLAPSGHPEEAIALSKKAIALSPYHPPVYLGQLGNSYHLSGRIADAIAAFKEYDARSPGNGFGLVDLVIIYQQNGQPDEAKRTAERLLAARPGFTIASWRKTQFRHDKARLEADLEALRAAGLP